MDRTPGTEKGLTPARGRDLSTAAGRPKGGAARLVAGAEARARTPVALDAAGNHRGSMPCKDVSAQRPVRFTHRKRRADSDHMRKAGDYESRGKF